MPGQKISELPSLANSAIAGDDLLPIVDTSAGVTKKITFADTISALNFPTRSAMILQAAVLRTMCPEGAVIFAGNLGYRKSTGATAISDFHDFLPFGSISPSHFKDNINPGTTDMSSAIDDCFTYVNTLGGILDGQTVNAIIDGQGEAFAMGSRVTLTDEVGITVSNCFFSAVGTWGSNLSLFNIPDLSGEPRRYIEFTNCTFEGSHKTNGVLITNSNGCGFTDCRFHGTPNYAIKTLTKAGELRIQDCDFRQYYWGESGFDIESNRTATLIDIDTADYIIFGNIAAYCFECLNIRSRGPGQVHGNHFYNGFLQSVTNQPRLMTVSGPNCQVIGNYFDNGIVRIDASQVDSTSITLIGNLFHKNGEADNTNELEFFGGVNSDLDGLVLQGNVFTTPSTAILYTGTYVSPELRKWAVSGNLSKSGGNIVGLPELANRDTFYSDTTDGFYYKGPNHTFTNTSSTYTNLRFNRSVNIDADWDDNSGTPESLGTLSVHGVEKFRWGESQLTSSVNMLLSGTSKLGLGVTGPDVRLHLAGETTDEDSRALFERSYDGSLGPRLNFRKTRGTLAAPTANNINDRLGTILWSGHTGSGYFASAEVRADALEAHASGSTPGSVVISTTSSGSTSLTERARVDSNGLTMSGSIILNGKRIYADSRTIADDAVVTFTPGFLGGTLDLKCGGGGPATQRLENFSAWIGIDIGTTPAIEKSTAFASLGADVNVVTSTTLTGTTGTDGKVTVSARNDGTFQVENRSGASRTFNLFLT